MLGHGEWMGRPLHMALSSGAQQSQPSREAQSPSHFCKCTMEEGQGGSQHTLRVLLYLGFDLCWIQILDRLGSCLFFFKNCSLELSDKPSLASTDLSSLTNTLFWKSACQDLVAILLSSDIFTIKGNGAQSATNPWKHCSLSSVPVSESTHHRGPNYMASFS